MTWALILNFARRIGNVPPERCAESVATVKT